MTDINGVLRLAVLTMVSISSTKFFMGISLDSGSESFDANPDELISEKQIIAHLFGSFGLLVDGKAINIRSEKARDLLALLIEKRGAFLSAREAITTLWECGPDDTSRARYRKVAGRLSLRQSGARLSLLSYHASARGVTEAPKVSHGMWLICNLKLTCFTMPRKEVRATMRESAKGLLGKILPLFVAATLACVGVFPVLGAEKSAFAANDGNGWQVVSGRYDATHETSEGIDQGQLGNYSFIESPDGSVRVTKTVEPTGVENEFIVHLSADTCSVSAQQTDYYAFFKNASYEGTTSGNLKEDSVGTLVAKMTGNKNVSVSGDASSVGGASNSGHFKIEDPNGNTIVEDVQLYWSQAQNVTFYLKLNDGSYVIVAARVRGDNLNNTVRLSKEAYDAINKQIEGTAKQGPAPTLNSVTDIMGDNIEYLGLVSVDAGLTSFNDATSTLAWTPQYSTSAKEVVGKPEHHYEYTTGGAMAKHTVIQKTWHYGAASLTYKVRLKTEGLSSSYNPDVVSNPNFTNNRATLDYSSSVYDMDTNTFVDKPHATVDFSKPEVKGITYDLRVLKWNTDDNAPLAGATFKLTRAWTDSNGVAHTDLVRDGLVSDGDGYVKVTGLPWGTYTLEETAAPSGFALPQDTMRTFNLCYTNDKDNLVSSTISAADKHRAMSATEAVRIDNERVKTDVNLLKVDADDNTKPLAGAKFSLYKDNGDGAFSAGSDALAFGDCETDDNGKVSFPQLTAGTYFLKETYTPAGYQLNNEVYRIQVFDVAGRAGGVDDNMIQVGKANGTDMRAPETPNTVTIADKPVPSMPITAGPGARTLVAAGVTLLVLGGVWLATARYREQRKLCSAAHVAKDRHSL